MEEQHKTNIEKCQSSLTDLIIRKSPTCMCLINTYLAKYPHIQSQSVELHQPPRSGLDNGAPYGPDRDDASVTG